jgi:hypothetical protein
MPDNAFYYHAAYVAAAAIYSGYALILWRRGRRVRAQLDAVERGVPFGE